MSGARLSLLTGLTLLAFAANSIFCRLALAGGGLDPARFTLLRLLSASVVLAVVQRARGGALLADGSWRGGLALLVYAAAFSFAYVSLGAAAGALLLFGAVQVTMIGAGLFAGEQFSVLQCAGFAAALLGLVVLLAPGGGVVGAGGAALMLLAGVAWGGYSLLGRAACDAIGATTANFLRATLLGAPLLLLAHGDVDAWGMAWAVMSGALASGLGYAVWYTVLPEIDATRAATLQLAVPVIAAAGAVLFLGEPLTLRLVAISAVILGGVAVVITVRGRRTARAAP